MLWLENEGGDLMKTENPLPKMIPGTLHAQMIRCGKPSCKCARGQLHGPYFYHFQRINGSLVKHYIKAADVAAMRAACDAYRRRKQRNRLEHKVNLKLLQRLMTKLREYEQMYNQQREF